MTTRMTSNLPTPQVRPLTRAGSLPDPLPKAINPVLLSLPTNTLS